MRSRAAIESLIRRNAEACEAATNPRCTCACGGALHGMKHSAAWVAMVATAVELGQLHREQAEHWGAQDDLFAVGEVSEAQSINPKELGPCDG